jgi:hypothetical protein
LLFLWGQRLQQGFLSPSSCTNWKSVCSWNLRHNKNKPGLGWLGILLWGRVAVGAKHAHTSCVKTSLLWGQVVGQALPYRLVRLHLASSSDWRTTGFGSLTSRSKGVKQ